MKYFIFFILGLFTFWTSGAYSLEIDEKLTLRVVKTSDTRKTVLINRGKEDGLAKGDHAKFYLSVGVVARGVAITISPTRSVWSLYRLVNADYIRDDQVMKLKITAPVKITKDESRSLVDDDMASSAGVRDPRDLGIPLAAGADDIDLQGEAAGQARGAQDDSFGMMSADLGGKNKEVFGAFSYDSRSSKTASENGNLDFSGEDTSMLLDVGFEYYFKDESKWYSRLSLLGAFRMVRSSILAYEGTEVREDASFFGGGVNWYPLVRPSQTYKFVPFGQFMYYMGNLTSSVSPSGGDGTDLSGAVSLISFGGGAKYFIHNGWGASAKLEYQSRTDDFSEDEGGFTWQKVSSGPRFIVSVSYRF